MPIYQRVIWSEEQSLCVSENVFASRQSCIEHSKMEVCNVLEYKAYIAIFSC
jgi:hypothetical protein